MAQTQSHILIGLKSGSLMCHQLTEQEMVDAKLEVPIFSPDLQVWHLPLSHKLVITGPVGVNHELIELHNNFPRFYILHREGLSEEDILSKVKEKGALILENLRKLRAKNDFLLLSKEEAIKNEDLFVDKIPSPKVCLA